MTIPSRSTGRAFAANGKAQHHDSAGAVSRGGLYRIDEMITHADEILDWEHMKQLIAEARPVHEPGIRHGYHALTYGWLIGGIIESFTGKPLQRVLQEELVDPLGLDGMFIGMPHNELYRRAKLITRDGIMPRAEGIGRLDDSVRDWIERAFAKTRHRILRVPCGDGVERAIRLECGDDRAGDDPGRKRSVHGAFARAHVRDDRQWR